MYAVIEHKDPAERAKGKWVTIMAVVETDEHFLGVTIRGGFCDDVVRLYSKDEYKQG